MMGAKCKSCYWFRFVKDHLQGVENYADNRGCTYGWEKGKHMGFPKKRITRGSVEIPGDRPVSVIICEEYKCIGLNKPFTE